MEQVEGSGDAPIEILSAEPSLLIKGDSAQMIRLFTNLLDNARRHTPSDGMVTVKADGDGKWVTIEVRDTGEGIPAEHLPHVCERFYRVDASRTRQRGGTGLGLSISNSIAASHGGRFLIDSVYGMGTVARVIIPQAFEGGEIA
jgi:signal transduction histidine kinase